MCCVLCHYRNVYVARGKKQSYIFKNFLSLYIFFGLSVIKNVFLGNLLPVYSHFRNVRTGEKNSTYTNHKRSFRKAILILCENFLIIIFPLKQMNIMNLSF